GVSDGRAAATRLNKRFRNNSAAAHLSRRTSRCSEQEKVTVMRTVILSILLAGAAATPAIAQDHGRWRQNQEQQNSPQPDGRETAREARQERQSEAREHRSEARPNFGRARQQEQQPQPQVQV